MELWVGKCCFQLGRYWVDYGGTGPAMEVLGSTMEVWVGRCCRQLGRYWGLLWRYGLGGVAVNWGGTGVYYGGTEPAIEVLGSTTKAWTGGCCCQLGRYWGLLWRYGLGSAALNWGGTGLYYGRHWGLLGKYWGAD